jgi:hypothetical protein
MCEQDIYHIAFLTYLPAASYLVASYTVIALIFVTIGYGQDQLTSGGIGEYNRTVLAVSKIQNFETLKRLTYS